MNKLLSTSLLTLTATATLQAATINVDFGDQAGAITATETYNTLTTTDGPGSPLLAGQNFLNLADTNGDATGVNLNVQVTGDAYAAGMTSSSHDSIAGIDDNALNDSFWVNNGNLGDDVDNQVNFVLTFSGLSASQYDIQLSSGNGVQRATTWGITTGTGDASTYIVAPASSTSGIGSWSSVTPTTDTITLTGSFSTNGAFNTTTVNFVSITAVPEPSSAALLALGGLALTLHRRK